MGGAADSWLLHHLLLMGWVLGFHRQTAVELVVMVVVVLLHCKLLLMND